MIDTHVHSIASGHAYSTLEEITKEASIKGIKGFVLTDHSSAMPAGAHLYHFHNMRILPREINGVKVFRGAETNIINFNGEVDLDDETLRLLEVVIASFHIPTCKPGTVDEHNNAYQKVMENPHIDIIGHPDDERYKYDVKSFVQKAGETKTIIELNNSSLLPTSSRIGARNNYLELLKECKRQGVNITLGSDTHFSADVGRIDASMSLLKEIDFPMRLIINLELEVFLNSFNIEL